MVVAVLVALSTAGNEVDVVAVLVAASKVLVAVLVLKVSSVYETGVTKTGSFTMSVAVLVVTGSLVVAVSIGAV